MKPDFVFEISWEVCNKVGGIYTVVRSKVPRMIENYGGSYFLIGPLFSARAQGEFQEMIPPEEFKPVFESLKQQGIFVHYGKWMVDGEPKVLLIDFSAFTRSKNDIKAKLWEKFGIDSLVTSYYDFDEPVIWATAVGKVIEELARKFPQKKFVAHFHEWLAGAGLLYLKMNNANVSTVFTTHATVLGRAMASQRNDFYEVLDSATVEEDGLKFGSKAKHQLEKASAHNASVFTTVSEITAFEAERLLKKRPDVLLPNGLDIGRFLTFEELTIKHQFFKRRIKEFAMYHFFPYYGFNLDDVLVFFIAGRYEFKDKGVDIFIKALGKLNQRLIDEKSNKTILTFFWIPGNVRGVKHEVLESKTFYQDVKDLILENLEEIKESILNDLLLQKKLCEESIFTESLQLDSKKKVMRFLKKGMPPVATHNLYDEEKDDILNGFKDAKLKNESSDRVKIIFYPIYLTSADGLLDLGYYESMIGSNLGVFPSYYEPWGYTPLETGALGVPSVTTDLAGFGRFIEKEVKYGPDQGIYILKRLHRSEEDVVNSLASFMYDFINCPKEVRIKNKFEARRLASLADWAILIKNYFDAHNLALERTYH